jgi:hypothetical protein
MLTFFQKYTKTPSDRIEKKGSLLLIINFPDYGTQWNFNTLQLYKENVLNVYPRYCS